jgi:LuxR family maltose regulon positive regulatory protein
MTLKKNNPSKSSRPILRKAVPRERLFERLDRFREGPVTWVSGPGGCGKTTLVSSYLQDRGLSSLWYQVEEADKDPATFFYHLGSSFGRAFPKRNKTLPLLTPEYLQGIPTFARRFFKEAFSQLKPGMMLVFDNFQLIPENSRVQEVILVGVDEIPPDNHLVLIGRKAPPPDWIRLQANQQLGLLTWEDLRLTLEEAVDIVRLRADRELPKKTVKSIHGAVNGWAAGLMLMLESLRRGIDLQTVEETHREGIVTYFGNEIFEKIRPEMQNFLLQTALLPRMTVNTVGALTGLPDSKERLSALGRNNYFVEQYFDRELVYQYHPLFREFLLSRAESGLGAEAFSKLTSRATALLEESGQPEAAAALFRQRSDWWGLVGLIMRNAPVLLTQARFGFLEEWLAGLPSEILESSPWLIFWAGCSRITYNPKQSRPYFEKAFEQFKAQEESTGLFLSSWGAVSSIIFEMADFKPLDHWIRNLEEVYCHYRKFPSDEIELRFVEAMFSALVYRKPEHPEIETWAKRAFSLAEVTSNINLKIHTMGLLAFYYDYIGRFEKALSALNVVRGLIRSRESNPFVKLIFLALESTHYLQTGWPGKCKEVVAEALELSRTTGIRMFKVSTLVNGIVAAYNLNDPIKVAQWIQEMESSLDHCRSWDLACYYTAKVLESQLRKDPVPALAYAVKGSDLIRKNGISIITGWCRVHYAQVMHALGRDLEATGLVVDALRFGQKIKGVTNRYAAFLTMALIAFDRGQETKGQGCLRKAFALGRAGEFFGPWGIHPDDLARLCSKALEYGIEVEYAREYIRRFHLKPIHQPVQPEHWPWPLKVYTLGQFLIYKDGQPLRFSRKAQKKPLELLKALIAAGARGIRDEELADALWPEADGDAAAQTLKTTLYRLRLLIGKDEVVKVREGRVTLDERHCWTDAWAFEQLLGEADRRNPQIAVPLLEKAVGLYQGPFLGRGMEEPWLLSAAERLRSKFLRGVERLGSLRSQNGEWEKSRECYLKGLEVDGLAEEFCRGALVCCRKLGLRAEGLSLYQRFEKRLKTELGIVPDARTMVVRDSLLEEAL